MTTKKPQDSPSPDTPDTPANEVGARGLLRSTSVVSGMTLVSRILGLVRDVVFARYFGATIVMDAFIVANRIPNMLRRFFAEGAFSQGFVPVMAQYKENNDHGEARQLVDAVAGTLGLILFVITLIGVIAAPVLILLVAPGFVGDSGRFDLAEGMLRLTFPYLFFVSLTAFAGGILNTYGRFAASAFTPVILNVVLIGFAVWLSPLMEQPGMALAWGVFVAGIVQLLFQIPFLAKIHAVPRPKWNAKHPGVRRIGALMLPAIFGSSVAQVNVLVSGVIASVLGVGKISMLYYADRLMEFPLGLFGIALATVTLPFLSRQHARQSTKLFSDALDWSLKLVFLIACPAAIGLWLLAEPLIATIFYGGEFTRLDVEMTALALQAYSIGLIGFSLVKILAPAFFARQDTRTPVRIGIVALIVNLILSIVLAYAISKAGLAGSHAGLALATSISAMVNAWLLYRGLRRDKVLTHGRDWPGLLWRFALANSAMAVALIYLERPLAWWFDASLFDRGTWLVVNVAVGGGVYFGMLLLVKLHPQQFRLHQR